MKDFQKRVCRKCGIQKILEEDFYKDVNSKGGRKWTCKDCGRRSLEDRIGRKVKPNVKKDTTQSDDGENVKAVRYITNQYIRKRLIDREPCCICGNEKSEAHHDQYDIEHIVDVVWLCRKHHSKYHLILNKIGWKSDNGLKFSRKLVIEYIIKSEQMLHDYLMKIKEFI